MSGANSAKRQDVVLVGDVHLDRDDPALEDFTRFLVRAAGSARSLILLGDLFNLWIGRRDLEQPHHRRVLDVLERLRAQGTVVRYVEGNRDFHIARGYVGSAVDESTDRGVVERCGGRSLLAIHGDLANPRDRSYRTWRTFIRSRLAWMLLQTVPRRRRFRLAEAIEVRMRSTNLDFKRSFPERQVRDYAATLLRRGHDAVVLGHFHVEQDLTTRPPSPPGRILVLPEWKSSRRFLRFTGQGELRFEDV